MDELLEAPFCMTICAPRKSGKSYFIKTILGAGLMKSFDKIKIFCPSLEFNDDYDAFRNAKKVELFPNPQISEIEHIISEMEVIAKTAMEHKRLKSLNKVKTEKVLMILDDCIDSGVFNFKGVIDKVAERGRHIDLSCIVASQRISAVSRSIRINSDYFIIFVPYSAREFEQFIEQFVFKDQRKGVIQKIMEIFATPFEFIMLNNTHRTIDEKIFHTNADGFIKNKVTMVPLEFKK